MLTSKQRSYLRGLSNSQDAIFHVGKLGITPELTEAIRDALEARELVKIDLLQNCPLAVKEVADVLSERTTSEVVQIIGKKIVFFRVSKNKPKIELPKI